MSVTKKHNDIEADLPEQKDFIELPQYCLEVFLHSYFLIPVFRLARIY
ncbi:hypothetical protein FDUTEX481_01643 [Tolypothrix sp. PCC 7601]|nr:hypothetical protein FDUTEX481_01643 [Tolypothrix sp. PCC 7601]